MTAAERETGKRRLRLSFAWYDLWVGAFWDRKSRTLYVCPLPCVLIEWSRRVELVEATTARDQGVRVQFQHVVDHLPVAPDLHLDYEVTAPQRPGDGCG